MSHCFVVGVVSPEESLFGAEEDAIAAADPEYSAARTLRVFFAFL